MFQMIILSKYYVRATSNKLVTVDIRNNANNFIGMYGFSTEYNPNLYCVQVDSVAYSDLNWLNIDSQTYFSTDCSYLNTEEEKILIDVFPNPVNNGTNIYSSVNANYVSTNIYGVVIKEGELFSGDNYLNLSEFITGVYFIVIESGNSQTINKIVKK